jgi:hypothetical protein
VVFDGVLIIERCRAIGCTTPFGVVYGLQVRAKILDAGDIVSCLTAGDFGELFPVGSIGEGDVRVCGVVDGVGEVEVVVAGASHASVLGQKTQARLREDQAGRKG